MNWMRRHRRGRPPHPDVLTPAEWRVLELVREGMPNAEIAVRLGITIRTVKSHITSILSKTGAPDRHALAAWDGRPAEASRAALGRGFALPLAEWFTAGAAVTGAKVAAGGVASIVFVVGVFVGYGFFFAEADERAERWLAGSDVIAVIDGIEVTTGEWRAAVELVSWEIRFQRLMPDGASAEDVAARARFADFLEARPAEVVALSRLVLANAALAEGRARGFEPTEDELAEYAESQRAIAERVRAGEFGTSPETLALMEEQRTVLAGLPGAEHDEDLEMEAYRSSFTMAQFAQSEGLEVYGGALAIKLARNADVVLRPDLHALVSMDDVYAFLNDYEALSEELPNSGGSSAVAPTPPPADFSDAPDFTVIRMASYPTGDWDGPEGHHVTFILDGEEREIPVVEACFAAAEIGEVLPEGVEADDGAPVACREGLEAGT